MAYHWIRLAVISQLSLTDAWEPIQGTREGTLSSAAGRDVDRLPTVSECNSIPECPSVEGLGGVSYTESSKTSLLVQQGDLLQGYLQGSSIRWV